MDFRNFVYRLRWAIETVDGKRVQSSYLPETRFPSIKATMEHYKGRIKSVIIEGENRFSGKQREFLKCDGSMFYRLSYKGFQELDQRYAITGGIQIEDMQGAVYLVMQDGNVYREG